MRLMPAVLMLILAAAAQGQQLPTPVVTAGDTVRLQIGRMFVKATVARSVTDTVELLDSVTGVNMPVPSRMIDRAYVQRGDRRGSVASGIVGGAFLGALLLGGAFWVIDCGLSCADDGEFAGFGAIVVGIPLGAVSGAVAGGFASSRSRRPRWVPATIR